MVILQRLIDLYELILFIGALLTWVAPGINHPIVRLIRTLTEPLLRPLRRVLPTMADVDISPVAAIVLLEILSLVLARLG